jgi:hypothetical protein
MPEEFDSRKLAELLQKSYRAESNARRALCFEIQVVPNELVFLNDRNERDFAFELVEYLSRLGKFQALLRLCDALAPVFRDSIYASEVVRLRAAIEQLVLPSERMQDPMT